MACIALNWRKVGNKKITFTKPGYFVTLIVVMQSQSVKNKEEIYQRVDAHQREIKNYGVNRLGVFGSFVRNQQKPSSDVDVLVDFISNKKNYDNFIGLAYFLEDILQRPVELVTHDSISKYFKPYIDKEVQYVTFR